MPSQRALLERVPPRGRVLRVGRTRVVVKIDRVALEPRVVKRDDHLAQGSIDAIGGVLGLGEQPIGEADQQPGPRDQQPSGRVFGLGPAVPSVTTSIIWCCSIAGGSYDLRRVGCSSTSRFSTALLGRWCSWFSCYL